MYYITRFGDYNFLDTAGNYVDSVASGGSFPSLTRTPDSWYDFRHETQAPRDISQIPLRKLVYAAPCAMSAANVYRDLLAKRGKRDRLFRTWKDTPFTQEWVWARLDTIGGVEAIHASSSRLFTLSDVSMTMVSPYWNGQGWGDTDYTIIPYYEGQTLSASQAAADVTFNIGGAGTTNIQLLNRGNREVWAVETDLINGAVSSSNYLVSITNRTDLDKLHGWSYDARTATGNPIGGGAFVTVNGGNRTVREDTGIGVTGTYSEFARIGANEQFLVLYPGLNDIRIVVTAGGGGGTIDLDVVFNYFDAWE